MPNDNIFGDGNPAPQDAPTQDTPPTPTPAVDPLASLLMNIKGEDGQQKYKDVPTALNALQHSQEYIRQLKTEMEELKTKASQAVTLDQVMEALNKKSETPATTQDTPKGVTAEDVVRILQETETQKVHKANVSRVSQRFKELHGDKAEEVFYSKANEMGLSRDAINRLAATSPAAVFSMFGMKEGPAPAAPAPSGVNTSGMQAPTPTPRSTVMGYKTDREILEYWKNLKNEVNSGLGIK